MSKQTINIGASPNDGTGTPLRTSFDYTNQNFTELYTALGGGVGLPGATTQVIFNDGGTNLAGDAGLVYNKTTDALTVAGLVTAGSATITGDLTVDTSTLKVDSTNNRVIVGHTSGSAAFQVTNAGAAGLEIQPTGFSSAPLIQSYNRSGSAYTQLTLDASTIVHALSGTTAMTLNSTGLGIGGSPSYKIHAVSSVADIALFQRSGAGGASRILISNGNNTAWGLRNAVNDFIFSYEGTDLVTFGSSGNVGVGVTPSVKLDVLSASAEGTIRLTSTIDGSTASPKGSSISLRSGSSSTETARIASFNRFSNVNGGDLVFSTADSSQVLQTRMTLDASGSLLIGTTSATVGATAARLHLSADGTDRWAVGPQSNSQHFIIQASNIYGVYLASLTATSWSSASDERLKDVIEPISNAVAKVGSLRAVIGKFKSDKTNTRKPFLMAQDVLAVLPEAVDVSKPDQFGLAYTDVIPLLVAAIKELSAEVNALKNA